MKRLIIGVVALAAVGCAAPPSPQAGGPGLVERRSATPGPGNPAGGENASGLISNIAGGLVANNAGGLVGAFRAPRAGLMAAHTPKLLAGDLAGLLAPASPPPSADPARLAAAPAGTRVTVHDPAGDVLGANFGARVDFEDAPITLDAAGAFKIEKIKPSGPVVLVRAIYRAEGHDVTLEALTRAPRSPGLVAVQADPASTWVARKLGAQLAARTMTGDNVIHDERMLATLAGAVDRAASEIGLVAGVVLPADQAVKAFDAMTAGSPALRTEVDAAAAAMVGLAP